MSSNAKPRRFAEGTSVEVSSSQEQIKRLVTQHGATGFLLAEAHRGDEFVGVVQFQIFGRMLRYERVYPGVKEAPRGSYSPKRWQDGEWRRRWRALHLIIKAKLELVASGDTSFEHEFLGDIMLPNGQTVGSQAIPAIKHAYETGEMPKLLTGGP
jgi:hypothetical protein